MTKFRCQFVLLSAAVFICLIFSGATYAGNTQSATYLTNLDNSQIGHPYAENDAISTYAENASFWANMELTTPKIPVNSSDEITLANSAYYDEATMANSDANGEKVYTADANGFKNDQSLIAAAGNNRAKVPTQQGADILIL